MIESGSVEQIVDEKLRKLVDLGLVELRVEMRDGKPVTVPVKTALGEAAARRLQQKDEERR